MSCLVFEYIDGCELFDYIQDLGSLEEREAARIFSQILNAVDFIHKNMVIHRQVELSKFENFAKSSNIVGT
jgi:serine/threonine protein kinase